MQIKGPILKARIAFVKDRFAEAGGAKVLAALPEADRKQLSSAMVVACYDFGVSDRLDKAIVSAIGGEDRCRARGDSVCRYQVSWR